VGIPADDPLDRPWPTDVTKRLRARKDPTEAALEDLFARNERRLGRFLLQMVRDHSLAEDLLQDTFHDAFRARAAIADHADPEAWLFALARNRALTALRRRRRSIGAISRLAHRVARRHDDPQEIVALHDLLQRTLDPEERALLLLRYLHGFEAHELAAMSDSTPEAVRQRLSRLRRRLITASEAQPRDTTEGGTP
jgi:RNA polymerase sigma-70 factor (ECF subfamily)